MPVNTTRSGLQAFPVRLPNKGLFSMISPHAIPDTGWASVKNMRPTFEGIAKVGGMQKLGAGTVLDGKAILLEEFAQENGTKTVLAGTPTRIYKYSSTTGAFTSIMATGETLSTPANYFYSTTTMEDKWFVTNGGDPIQVWTGAGDLADLAGSPPKAYQMATLANRIVVGDVDESGDRTRNKIMWSGPGNSELWDSGDYLILDTPDPIVAMKRLRDFIVIYTESMLYLLRPVPSPDFFQPVPMAANVSLVSPRAIAEVISPLGSGHLIMAKDNVYLFDGVNIQALGDPVHRALYRQTDPAYIKNIFGFFDPMSQESFFGMAEVSHDTTDTNIAYSYHLRLKAWGQRELKASSAVSATVFDDKSWADFTQPLSEVTKTWIDVTNSAEGHTVLVGGNDEYTTGTATQSALAVTGTNTVWLRLGDSSLVGRDFVYADGTSVGPITAVNSDTQLTVTVAASKTDEAYSIFEFSRRIWELDTQEANNETGYDGIAQTKYYDCGMAGVMKRLAGIQIDASNGADTTLDVTILAKEKLHGEAIETDTITWTLNDREGETFIDLDVVGRYFAVRFETKGANLSATPRAAGFDILGFTLFYDIRESFGEGAGV